MTEPNLALPSRTPLWMRIALGVSVALNLAVIGLAGGIAMRFGGPQGMRAHARGPGSAMYRELPRQDRRALLSQIHEASRDRWRQRRQEVTEIGAALRVTPFDKDAMQALLSAHAAKRQDWQSATQQAWLQRVSEMSDADRADFADRMEQASKHSRKQRPKDRHN